MPRKHAELDGFCPNFRNSVPIARILRLDGAHAIVPFLLHRCAWKPVAQIPATHENLHSIVLDTPKLWC